LLQQLEYFELSDLLSQSPLLLVAVLLEQLIAMGASNSKVGKVVSVDNILTTKDGKALMQRLTKAVLDM
jgi:hypothetical protein